MKSEVPQGPEICYNAVSLQGDEIFYQPSSLKAAFLIPSGVKS